MGKTILKKVKDKIIKGWVLCQNIKYGIPYWYFLKDGKKSKYPYITEEIFYNELFDNVPYRRYNYIKGVEFEEIRKCQHKNITRSDGLDECLDCGARNY